jgi:hypothetical protein
MSTSDYGAMLRCLNRSGAKYLVVGGHAVMRYTEPRFTRDLDIWIGCEATNVKRVFAALGEFGAPLAGFKASDLEKPDMVLQIGVAPVRVDILTGIPGLDFDTAWSRRETANWEGEPACFASKTDLIEAKRVAGRPQDLLDLRALLEAKG